MADFSLIDRSIMSELLRSENDFRNVMLMARRLREGGFEINATTLILVEDFLFTAGVGLTSVRARIADRLAQYRELGESAFDAVAALEQPDASLQVAPYIVITGSYRPVPANDQIGGAA